MRPDLKTLSAVAAATAGLGLAAPAMAAQCGCPPHHVHHRHHVSYREPIRPVATDSARYAPPPSPLLAREAPPPVERPVYAPRPYLAPPPPPPPIYAGYGGPRVFGPRFYGPRFYGPRVFGPRVYGWRRPFFGPGYGWRRPYGPYGFRRW